MKPHKNEYNNGKKSTKKNPKMTLMSKRNCICFIVPNFNLYIVLILYLFVTFISNKSISQATALSDRG